MTTTSITSKGQTTIPIELRKVWRTKAVVWETCADGTVRVRPVPDVMALFGAAHDGKPRDVDEKRITRDAMGRGHHRRS